MAFKSITGKLALPNGTKVKYDMTGGIDTNSVSKNFDMIKDFMMGTKKPDLSPLKGSGKITGIVSELPMIGFVYIIETDSKVSDEYPYTSFVCPEIYLEQI